jgi:hypothetical protein
MKRILSTALIALSLSVPAVAQQAGSIDPARPESVVREAMRSYQQGLNEINASSAAATQPGTTSVQLREMRLEDAVSLALEKNLDIQVARLEPQSVDFLVAGFRNTYRPSFSSTVGMRD